jgi:hypothetical protein
MAGSAFQGVIPFDPLPGNGPGAMLRSSSNGMFGSMGGLKGGGLGVPLDPVSDQKSDPINDLINMLTQGKGQL